MNTLTYGTTVLPLHDDLDWPDEFDWQAVEQRERYTIFGALRVEAAAKQAGQPITLQGSARSAWLPRSTVKTLAEWAALPGQQFTLACRGSTYTVVFNQRLGALQAAPVVDYSDPADPDFYIVTLRFLKV